MEKRLLSNITRLAATDLDLEIKIRVLINLLVENGLVTHEEFKKMCADLEAKEFPGSREQLSEVYSDLRK